VIKLYPVSRCDGNAIGRQRACAPRGRGAAGRRLPAELRAPCAADLERLACQLQVWHRADVREGLSSCRLGVQCDGSIIDAAAALWDSAIMWNMALGVILVSLMRRGCGLGRPETV
jgi:hypothetical protein